jgi:hypothetical protein
MEKIMRNIVVQIVISFLSLLVVTGLFADTARAGKTVIACSLSIGKDAGGADVFFEFLVEPSGGDAFELTVASGQENGFGLNFGESAVVTEIVPDGWRLVNVVCETSPGLAVIVDEDNNVLVNCLTTGAGVCTFTNVQSENIPTLSEWGMITAAAVLVLVGVFFAVRRKRAAV